MKTFTAIAAATALLVSAGIASANSALPLNPNKSSQANEDEGLAGLIGGEFAGGTILTATMVGALVVLLIANDDGTTTTTTVSTGSLF